MSWPQDGEPRYVVTSCSGYLGARRSGGARTLPGQSWLVLDRAHNHRTVVEYRHEWIVKGGRISHERGIAIARERAEGLAARLNAENAVGSPQESMGVR